jgi:asparagine synthase (glutamine-hydrolysing)
MFPVAYWFRNELHSFIKRMLMDSHFVREGLFRQSAVSRLVEEHRNGRVDNHVRLWMLLNLELWHQIYVEQHDLEIVGERIQIHL